jgi:hypothetical protein
LTGNPRPGGGANVHAIKLISGIDLNKECIRLWAGGPKPRHEKPLHSSVSFAVRYPSQIGFVSFVRKKAVLKSSRGRVEWIPLIEQGARVDHRLREQYLGVLLAPDLCRRASDIGSTTRYLVVREESRFQFGLINGCGKSAVRIWHNKRLSQRIRRRKL